VPIPGAPVVRRRRISFEGVDLGLYPLPTSVVVFGRRWFDGFSTYHSVAVWADSKLVGVAPFSYGYERQYEETGLELLVAAGRLPVLRYSSNGIPLGLWRTCEELGVGLVNDSADVARRRDLHRGGRGHWSAVTADGRELGEVAT
jgi:hypothetical protein